jgi:predicted phage tail protein
MDANFPGFLNEIRIGKFHVLKGDIDNDPEDLGTNKTYLLFQYKDNDDFHIMPAIEGAGGDDGWWTVIVGVVLVAATWWAGGAGGAWAGFIEAGGAIYEVGMAIGVSLILSGASQLLSPTPQISSTGAEREAEKPSFVFNGPVNRSEQGGPVTLVYGEIITGSIVAGGAIDIEEY